MFVYVIQVFLSCRNEIRTWIARSTQTLLPLPTSLPPLSHGGSRLPVIQAVRGRDGLGSRSDGLKGILGIKTSASFSSKQLFFPVRPFLRTPSFPDLFPYQSTTSHFPHQASHWPLYCPANRVYILGRHVHVSHLLQDTVLRTHVRLLPPLLPIFNCPSRLELFVLVWNENTRRFNGASP